MSYTSLDVLRSSLAVQTLGETPESTLSAFAPYGRWDRFLCFKTMTIPLPELSDEGRIKFEALVEKRIAGTPIAHHTGRQQFMGAEMLAGLEGLIPRGY